MREENNSDRKDIKEIIKNIWLKKFGWLNLTVYLELLRIKSCRGFSCLQFECLFRQMG